MKLLSTLMLMMFMTGSVYAACASITGNSSIDGTCCADASSLSYSNSAGESTHDAYLGCVAEAVVELRLDGQLSEPGAENLVADQASTSGVNGGAN